MNCPRCGLDLASVTAAYCPRCGEPLPPKSPVSQGYPSYPTGSSGEYVNPAQPSTPLDGSPAGGGPYTAPSWQGDYATYAPPSAPYPPYNSYAPPASSGPAWQAQPPYGPYGSYGAGAPPSAPMYQSGGAPYYGQSAPPSMPLYPPPGAAWPGYAPPAPPQSRGKAAIVVAVTLVLVLVLAAVAGIALIGHGTTTPSSAGGPTTTPGNNVVFSDQLTSNTNGWSNSSYCHFASGGYQVTNRICYAPTGDFATSVISVQTSQVSGPINVFYGLVLRRTSAGNYYAFQIDSNGKWRFFKAVNDKATEIQPYIPNAAIRHGLKANNLLKVSARGSHFDFFVNGVKVGQADDSTFTSGRCGFEVYDKIAVVFSNFTIAVPS